MDIPSVRSSRSTLRGAVSGVSQSVTTPNRTVRHGQNRVSGSHTPSGCPQLPTTHRLYRRDNGFSTRGHSVKPVPLFRSSPCSARPGLPPRVSRLTDSLRRRSRTLSPLRHRERGPDLCKSGTIGLWSGAGPHHLRAVAEDLGRQPEASRYSPDKSGTPSTGTTRRFRTRTGRCDWEVLSSTNDLGEASPSTRRCRIRCPRKTYRSWSGHPGRIPG